MKKRDAKWNPTAKRFVAFFDIMGFKDMVLKKGHNEVGDILYTLFKGRKLLEDSKALTSAPPDFFGEVKSFAFSDSIIFFSKGESPADLHKIMLSCIFILRGSLMMQVPIKGALSYGEITVDLKKSIFFGQPIIDAYTLHEELMMYGVILDNAFEKKAKDLLKDEFNKSIEFYKTPLKSGKAFHNVLKPLKAHEKEFKDNLNKLYETVSGRPRQYIDNTIEFIESLNKRSP